MQIERLRNVKARRNQLAVEGALQKLKEAAKGTDNLMPHILNAVRSYGSIGEICNTLREVFGEYKESVIL